MGAWAHEGFDLIDDAEATFKKVLIAAKVRMEPGQRQKLTWHDDRCIALILAKPEGELLFGVRYDLLANASIKFEIGFGENERRSAASVVSTGTYIRIGFQLAWVF